MIFKKLINIFSLKSYSKELKISPVFVETTASMIAGVIMIAWGFTFFSNSTFQYSLFTKLRNIFINEKSKKNMLNGIYTFGIDYEAKLKAEEKNLSTYDLIGESIKIISDYARENPEKRITAGLDFVLLNGLQEEEKNNYLASVLANLPSNMYLIFGGAIYKNANKTSFLRIEYLNKSIIEPAADLYEGDDYLPDKIFLGNIHYIKSGVMSGLENDIDEKIALGYRPLFDMGGENYIISLPFIMYLAGYILPGDIPIDFYTDFNGAGLTKCSKDLKKLLKEKSGYNFEYLKKNVRYNFFTAKDAEDLAHNSLSLSNFSAEFSNLPVDFSLTNHFNMLKILNKGVQVNTEPVEYFFIYQTNPPAYIVNDSEIDEIITPASLKNRFTYERNKINGVMAHVIALSNLKNSFIIKNTPLGINIIILLILSLSIFLISWNNELNRSLFFSISILILYLISSVILFFYGIFLPVQMTLAGSFSVFAFSTLIRFFYTTKNIDIYQVAIRKIFPASLLKKIEQSKTNPAEPSVVRDGIIMILFLKELPAIEKTESSAMIYTKLYEKYMDQMFKIIEKFEGSHDQLYMDGIIGFWNVVEKNEANNLHALDCAKKCIDSAKNFQNYINKINNREKYQAYFDICLHRCDFFAGVIGSGEVKNYAISSKEVNFAISAARSQTTDRFHSILMTEEFYNSIKNKIMAKPKKITTLGRVLFKL